MKRLLLALLTLILCPCFASGGEEDIRQLLTGVPEIAAPGVPGPLAVFGEDAFPVVVGTSGKETVEPVVAAARYQKGRVVAFGHSGYLRDTKTLAEGPTGKLLVNAIRWTAQAGSGKTLRVAVYEEDRLADVLRGHGLAVESLRGSKWQSRLAEFDVLCLRTASLSRNANFDGLRQFVAQGGGLIACDLGWGWLQLNRGKTLTTDHQGNQLLSPMGIVWCDGTLKTTSPGGFSTKEPISRMTHAGVALKALATGSGSKISLSPEQIRQAVRSVEQAARGLPADEQQFRPMLEKLTTQYGQSVVPTEKRPLSMKVPLERLLLTMEMERAKDLPLDKVVAHPAASEFPGSVPEGASRTARVVAVDTSVPQWHSTGLYAAPGEPIEVTLSGPAVSVGLKVRIGAHKDKLWHHDAWRRVPEITAVYPITEAKTTATCAFGGLVYIEVPKNCKPGTIHADISGAVEAPYFVLGETSEAEWRDSIRNRPAPWAELATDNVILTVQSEVIRDLDSPVELMRFWDDVLDACADLSVRPRDRERPERYVTDVQISAGYMHAGYPIMTHLDIRESLVNKELLMTKGQRGVWGFYHEVGHNHQSSDWTFSGTGEVTVNLFSLYVLETVCGQPIRTTRDVMGEGRKAELEKYAKTGRDFTYWKSKPFLALLMYVQLQEAFGWEAYKQVFTEYRDLPQAERPKNDDEKRDQWMVRFSRTVGRNLGPFFEAWGVPTSEEARASIRDLPGWMPKE